MEDCHGVLSGYSNGRVSLAVGYENNDELSDWGLDESEQGLAVPNRPKAKKRTKKKSTTKTSGRCPRNGIQRELARDDAGALLDPDRRVHLLASLQTKSLEPQAVAEFYFYLGKVVEADSSAIPTILQDEKEGLAILTARVSRSDVKSKVNQLLGALDLMRLTWTFNT